MSVRTASQLKAPARAAVDLAPWRRELRALAGLAWPLATTQLAQMAVTTTDILMLGRLGKDALASAALGSTIFYFAWMIGFGPVAALSPMIAQARGRTLAYHGEVRRISRMGLWALILLAPGLCLTLLCAGPILLALRQDPRLAAGAARLVGLFAIGLPFSLVFQALRSIATALGRPRPALVVMTATIAFNALADYALIFGNLGCPRLGLAGAGLATSSSYVFSAAAMALVFRGHPELRRVRMLRRFGRPRWGVLLEIARLGLPIGLTMMFEMMIFNTMTLVTGVLGATPLAAHQIALNVASITFMVPLGVGMAATVRVGAAAGAGDRKGVRRAGYGAMILALGFISVCGVAMALFGREIAGLYLRSGSDPAGERVRDLAGTLLLVAAAFQVFDAVQVVAAMCLRGLKDARAPMLIAGASYWLAGAPVCLLLAFPAGLGVLGIWIGLAVGLAVAAVSLLARFARLSGEPRASGP